MNTIALTMIMKNEEEVIERCLTSFTGDNSVFDAIHLTDTGSTDNTVLLALKYTDYVFHFDWIDDFAAARNFCLDTVNWKSCEAQQYEKNYNNRIFCYLCDCTHCKRRRYDIIQELHPETKGKMEWKGY